MNCPKCDADIGDSYEPDDPSVGICGGWYCDACDLAIGEHEVSREPLDDDVPIMTAKEFRGDRPLGTPISELSSRPGDPNNPSDPRHAGYGEFCRIARILGARLMTPLKCPGVGRDKDCISALHAPRRQPTAFASLSQ